MSYKTAHYVYIQGDGPSLEEVACKMAEITTSTPDKVKFWVNALMGEQDITWSDHTKNMKIISQTWPGVLFAIMGRGENTDDQWMEYHMDGKTYCIERPEWDPPAFDPDMLEQENTKQ